jgi:hypothetical protein
MRVGVAVSLAASILVAVVAPLVFSLRSMREETKTYPFRVEHLDAAVAPAEFETRLGVRGGELYDAATLGVLTFDRG